MNGCSGPVLANWSAVSFPTIPSCPGTHFSWTLLCITCIKRCCYLDQSVRERSEFCVHYVGHQFGHMHISGICLAEINLFITSSFQTSQSLMLLNKRKNLKAIRQYFFGGVVWGIMGQNVKSISGQKQSFYPRIINIFLWVSIR
jgi:hypothetical protein